MLERDKYEHMHRTREYRTQNMGLPLVEDFLSRVSGRGSVADFGAGNGLSSEKLAQHFNEVIPVDIAFNALAAQLPNFVAANLWEDTLPFVDWGFCTDVMEHIPTEHVGATLVNISVATRLGCYFQISNVPDICGPKELGIHLHLTVESPAQWVVRLMNYFEEVELLGIGSGVSRYLCTHSGRK